MRNMEVRITSRETIQPYSLEAHLLKPFMLSFLDQLAPSFYVPLIFFHTQSQLSSHSSSNAAQISAQLKTSLSQTLNHFYPFSGRPRDNLYIDSYQEGVPYIEARVNCCLSDYLLHVDIEQLNQLLPFESFCSVTDPTAPLLAVQLNTFDCGGIALAVCTSHKIADASTASAFFRSWSAFSRGSNGEIPLPDLLSASSKLFPPMDMMPPNTSLSKGFNEDRSKTKRFVFDEMSIDALKFKAKSKALEHPTRVQALTAFIWKHAMLASRSASGTSKPSVCMHSVNLRQKLEPQVPDYSIGNMYWCAISPYNPAANDIELQSLAYLVKEGRETLNKDFLNRLRSEGVKSISEGLNDSLAKLATEVDIEIYYFNSWLNFSGFHEVDFGWGKPSFHDLPGVVSHGFPNNAILKDFGKNKEIEAWVTLKERTMAILENDPEFLAFASPNPHSNRSKI